MAMKDYGITATLSGVFLEILKLKNNFGAGCITLWLIVKH